MMALISAAVMDLPPGEWELWPAVLLLASGQCDARTVRVLSERLACCGSPYPPTLAPATLYKSLTSVAPHILGKAPRRTLTPELPYLVEGFLRLRQGHQALQPPESLT